MIGNQYNSEFKTVILSQLKLYKDGQTWEGTFHHCRLNTSQPVLVVVIMRAHLLDWLRVIEILKVWLFVLLIYLLPNRCLILNLFIAPKMKILSQRGKENLKQYMKSMKADERILQIVSSLFTTISSCEYFKGIAHNFQ